MASLLALAGCSIPERTDYKNDAAKGRPLDMPPDLVPPKGETKYTVPEGTETSATYSEYAKNNAAQNQACTCANPAQPEGAAAQPAVAPVTITAQSRPDGAKLILISEPFDRCWLRVSQALDKAGIAVEDKDRSKGLFYLKNGHNQLSVQGKGAEGGKAETCEVMATGANGKPTPETMLLTESLLQALNK